MILAEHGRYEILLLAGRFFCCPKRCRCKHGSSSPLKKRRRKHEDKN
ncbi:hypothetical protein MUY_002446 [Bacillus licheniformis WX-02]|nr:hypothetical protein MUY_002446 [Bacillus licheniformis WX-02]